MLADRIELILLITGLATASAVVLFLAPAATTRMIFGQVPSDALGILITRHWGLVVGLVGALLIYAAYHSEVRVPVLIVAIVEKAAIVFGVITSSFRRRPTVLVVALADGGMAAVYLLYLAGL